MTKTNPAPRVRALNLYTVEQDGRPVAQALAISQAEAVRLYIESVQQPTMTARLSSPMEARTLAHLPLLSREAKAPERDPRVPDMFDDVPAAPVSPVVGALFDAPMTAPISQDAVEHLQACGVNIVAVTEELASGLPAEFVDYIDGQESAAAQPGEPAGCLDAAPTAVESAGASSEGFDLQVQEVLDRRMQCNASGQAGEDAENIRGELKRQAEQASVRRTSGVPARYRDPATGQTWSGRGLKPKWLLAAIKAGRTQDEFLIDPA